MFVLHSFVVNSLPFCIHPGQMDDSQKRVNGDVVSKKTSVPSRYHQFMTSEDEAQSSSAHSSEEEEEEEEGTTAKGVTSSQSISSVKNEVPESPVPTKETSQVLSLLLVG